MCHSAARVQPQVACSTGQEEGRQSELRARESEFGPSTPNRALALARFDVSPPVQPRRSSQTQRPGSQRVIRHPTGLSCKCAREAAHLRIDDCVAVVEPARRVLRWEGREATREQSGARWSWRAGSGVDGSGVVGAFGARWRRQRDGARPRRSRCFGGHSAHICATRLLARLSHGTARMRTATAHDAARTRARQGHSQGCCGGTTARTRHTRITQAGSRSTHARAPPARARAGGARSAGRRSTQNGTRRRERASERARRRRVWRRRQSRSSQNSRAFVKPYRTRTR